MLDSLDLLFAGNKTAAKKKLAKAKTETNKFYSTKTIWYKNWKGNWVKSELNPTKKNLEYIRKNYALNGQCEIFVK